MTVESTNPIGSAAPGGIGESGIAPDGYRLPSATRLGRVALQVAELSRSIRFYEEVIGLRVLDRSEGSASLGPAGGGAGIVELRERKGAAPVPRSGRLGLYHFAILLPERAALGRFLKHLSTLGVRAGASDHLVSEALYLSDPDGLGIEVYADRPRSSWRHVGGQLAMATEPLDADDLLRESGSEAWSGAPAGTTIGHVHLHVGEIPAAAAFYHRGVGFDRMVWSYPGALFLSAGGYHHHLGVNTWAVGAPPAGEGEARLLEWEIVVPTAEDVARVADSLRRGGALPEEAGETIRVRDPWGTPLRVAAAGAEATADDPARPTGSLS